MKSNRNKISIQDEAVQETYKAINKKHLETVGTWDNRYLEGGHFVKVIDGDVHKVNEKAFTMFYLNIIYKNSTITYIGETKMFYISHKGSVPVSYDADELANKVCLLSEGLLQKCNKEGNKYTDKVLEAL